jgi:hypothetical protein
MIICDRCNDNTTGTVKHCSVKITISDNVSPNETDKTVKDEYIRTLDLCAKCRKEIHDLVKEKPTSIPHQWIADQKRLMEQADPR